MEFQNVNLTVQGEKWVLRGIKAVKKFYGLLSREGSPLNESAVRAKSHRASLEEKARREGMSLREADRAADEAKGEDISKN